MRIMWKAAAAAVLTCACGAPAAAAQEGDGPPAPPPGLIASFTAPAHDAGGWATPNRNLSAAETAWHLRVALNVAALGCRGEREAATIAGYNALLASEKAALTAASEGTAAAYKARYGAAWQARFDDEMTKLYNFWAQPAAHDDFCAAADAVLADAAVVEPTEFGAFATAALPRLEAPFLAVFAAADRYHADLAAWRAAHEPQVALATAAPAPVSGGMVLP